MEVEDLAKVLHESGREAVEKKMTVVASLGLQTPTKFLEWDEITEEAKEGRRIQARYLLKKYNIDTKQFTVSELIDIKMEYYGYNSIEFSVITDFIDKLIEETF